MTASAKDRSASAPDARAPAVTPWLVRGFTRYVRRHLVKHFHSVRLSKTGGRPAIDPAKPLVVFGNHSSWWDPLIAIFLTDEIFSPCTAYAPIDEEALAKYRIFARLGFFPIDRNSSARGAAQFLRTVQAVLSSPNAVLWITPQGNFNDPRQRPVTFDPGIAHIAKRIPGTVFLPIATEYPFWEERFPETLIRFGEPVVSNETARDTAQWLELLQSKLESAQDALATEALKRDPDDFEILLRGSSGAAGAYDLWRRFSAKLRGQSFTPEHGNK